MRLRPKRPILRSQIAAKNPAAYHYGRWGVGLTAPASPTAAPVEQVRFVYPKHQTRVFVLRGIRYTVESQPRRHRDDDFLAGDSGPVRIAPGTCDVYEGSLGSHYLCCKSADGQTIDCYRIVHQDPWGPPLPSRPGIRFAPQILGRS